MELHYLSATEALSKFKNKTLSPVELTKAIIERSEKVNSKINAHNFTFYEEAITNAKKSVRTNIFQVMKKFYPWKAYRWQ